MEFRKEVILDEPAGTLAIMEYADAHPNESFGCTIFRYGKRMYGYAIVSDCDANNPFVWENELFSPIELPNGWERVDFWNGTGSPSWYCRKNGRCLFITC